MKDSVVFPGPVTDDLCGAEGVPRPPVAEMVERVAARIWLFSNTCALTISGWRGSEDCECMIDARYAARAALDEMRQPTEAMIAATVPSCTQDRLVAIHNYRAMIDAALAAARARPSPPQVMPPIRDDLIPSQSQPEGE